MIKILFAGRYGELREIISKKLCTEDPIAISEVVAEFSRNSRNGMSGGTIQSWADKAFKDSVEKHDVIFKLMTLARQSASSLESDLRLEWEDQLFRLYESKGLIGSNGEALPLHLNCPMRNSCWNDLGETSYPPSTCYNWSRLSLPYIGSDYHKSRILVCGMNQNKCGGYFSLNELVWAAQKEINDGFSRVRFVTFGNTKERKGDSYYKGTFLWKMIGSYTLAVLQQQGVCDISWADNEYPPPKLVASAFNHIAYTNLVKCSPDSNKSSPTPSMLNACGPYLLEKEIKILNPKTIIVLGKTLYTQVRKFLQDGGSAIDEKISQTKSGLVAIIRVPHPTSRGGNSVKLPVHLHQLLCRNTRSATLERS